MTQKSTPRGPFKSPIFLAILFIWFAATVVLSMQEFFESPVNTFPIIMPAALVIPPVLFLLALSMSKGIRAWADSVDVAIATSFQSWRVIGATFVFLWGLGQLPLIFSVFAGFGDIAVGLTAAFATITVAKKQEGWQNVARRVIYIGVLDFIFAITTGLATASGYLKIFPEDASGHILTLYPVVLFPVFIVPCFMIMHILVWRKL